MEDSELREAWPRAAEHIALVPEHMRGATSRWILKGIIPGDFLRSVLSNNLSMAFQRADPVNLLRLGNWITYLDNYTPIECHGSEERVRAWKNKGGLLGPRLVDAE